MEGSPHFRIDIRDLTRIFGMGGSGNYQDVFGDDDIWNSQPSAHGWQHLLCIISCIFGAANRAPNLDFCPMAIEAADEGVRKG
jgi:hypothetical protein